MFFLNTNKIYFKISSLFFILLLVTSFSFAPLSQRGQVPTALAQRAVLIVGDTSPSSMETVVQTTISAGANAVVAGLQEAFFIKEFTLDGIFNGLAKMILKSMTQSILTWINSGFEGKPAFVTDLKQFIIDRADQVAGDFIYNNEDLNFLCSPFQLDVKIALATTYQEQRGDNFSEAQCTLSDVTDNVEGFLSGSFSEGGWASWFEMTQNPVNTPTGAYLAAEGELYARIVDDEGNTVNELEWGKGFLSFKVCSEAQKASGAVKNCSITTPGTIIEDATTVQLQTGTQALIEADEIDEIIGAFFAQIAKQAITGINGLLGLGGGSSFSDNSFGSSGTNSFLDELESENPTIGGGSVGNPFERSLTLEAANTTLQNLVITVVNDSEASLGSAVTQYGSCLNVTMPQELKTQRENAILQIIISSSTSATLINLNEEYITATDPAKQLETIQVYNQMSADGLLINEIDNTKLELFIKNDLTTMVKALETKVQAGIAQCNRGNGGNN